jgi:glycosyltransferase involved in cell wall biosynthesis
MSDLPTVSVVVTTHNRLSQLRLLLDELLDQDAVTEIVVVADDCVDGTDAYLAALSGRAPRVVPVALHPNVGQPWARYEGVRAASCEVVLSLDDDVHPSDGLVRSHAEAHRTLSRAVVVGYMPTVVPSRPARGLYATREYARVYEQNALAWERDSDQILSSFWAGNFSLRREDFLTALADPEFLVRYHEDRELGLRFQRAGLRAVFDRSLLVHHRHSRGWAAYLREGVQSAQALVILADAFPGEVDLDPAAPVMGSAPPVRWAISASRWSILRVPIMAFLRLATVTAGVGRLYRAEAKFAFVAKQVAWRHALRAATSRRSRSGERVAASGAPPEAD